MNSDRALELVCPAGTPAALRVAVDAGADSVYCGFQDETNARNFPGLNFSRDDLAAGIAYAHRENARVLVAINTFPRAGSTEPWRRAVDDAAALGADAVILADLGLLDYASRRHPDLRLHLSVQAAAANADAVGFHARTFGVKRVVLPRVLTVDEIARLNAEAPCETEVFVFGGLCVMAEGRCSLSSYATGRSPNMQGVCSPPSHVRYEQQGDRMVSRLGGFTIDRVPRGSPAPYPTLCKGCFVAGPFTGHVFDNPASLDAGTLLARLAEAGVTAVKIEGRQRSRAYIRAVVETFRHAIDTLARTGTVPPVALARLSEANSTTTGAYRKTWR